MPEIFGPDAAEIIQSLNSISPEKQTPETIKPDAPPTIKEIDDFFQEVEKQLPLEVQQKVMFPFGEPDKIDWTIADKAGIQFIMELNKRPWIKTTEYCSGHPLDRPNDELSQYYPYRTGENVYEELAELDQAYVRGLIPDQYYRYRKSDLRQAGQTRFYVNANIYNVPTFMKWTKVFSTLLMTAFGSDVNPLCIKYNALRPATNFTLSWDYWTLAERELVHQLALESLSQFPV